MASDFVLFAGDPPGDVVGGGRGQFTAQWPTWPHRRHLVASARDRPFAGGGGGRWAGPRPLERGLPLPLPNGSHWQLGSRAALVNHGHHRVVAAGRFHLCQSSPCVLGFLGLFVLLLEAIVGGLGIFIVRVVGVLRLVILLGLVFVQ